MNFIDQAAVTVRAGNGGDGAVSFRHEKFIDRGGPDGGDGGDGGDVILVASNSENTLANFRYEKELTAEAGGAGSKQRKHGKNGSDLLVKVPVGTAVVHEGQIIADLTKDGQQAVIARGGQGGFGNAHFVSSTRQAPRFAEKGEPGDQLAVTFELKMIADVGLVGLPNAGKSTLLSIISNARPEIADYPFTTLTPNLGMVDVDGTGLLFADIPGLIEGAASGKGLGDEFLRHVERTAVLLHLIDAYQEDVVAAYRTIQQELADYKIDLSERPQIVALTKIEGLDHEIINDQKTKLTTAVPVGTTITAISAKSKEGLTELLRNVKTMVLQARSAIAEQPDVDNDSVPVLTLPNSDLAWQVKRDGQDFVVTGRKIERFAMRTDTDSLEGLRRLRDIMQKMGIMHELKRQGVQTGDQILIPPQTKFPF